MSVIRWINKFLENPKTQKMCNEAAKEEPSTLVYIPNCFKTQEMYNKVVPREPYTLEYVLDHLKT